MDYSFTEKGYTAILQSALKSGYRFLFFHENRNINENICLLRHDIDADLYAALEMAEIEHSLGICSTYFLMTRSSVYNLFSRVNMELALKIKKLGHEIGLHFDEGYYPHSKASLQEFIDADASFLELQLGQKIMVVSFHQPGEKILTGQFKLKNYINTYDKTDLNNVAYISDSNKIWKEEHPVDLFKSKKYSKLQLLIHPMWWICDEKNTSTSLVWDSALLRNFQSTQNFLHKTEGAYKHPGEITIKNKLK